jgi:hypothetical protein
MPDLTASDLGCAARPAIRVSRRRAVGLLVATLGLSATGCAEWSPIRALLRTQLETSDGGGTSSSSGQSARPTATPTGPRAPGTWPWIADQGAPDWSENHAAVWAGREMIVWGGKNVGYHSSNRKDGARWRPFG